MDILQEKLGSDITNHMIIPKVLNSILDELREIKEMIGEKKEDIYPIVQGDGSIHDRLFDIERRLYISADKLRSASDDLQNRIW